MPYAKAEAKLKLLTATPPSDIYEADCIQLGQRTDKRLEPFFQCLLATAFHNVFFPNGLSTNKMS